MSNPSPPRRPASGPKKPVGRRLVITAVLVVGVLLLTLGGGSVSFTTGELTRGSSLPIVGEDSEQNAAHGLDKHGTATNGTTDPLVNVTNNFETGSNNLGYKVTLLNNTGNANLNVSGTDEGNQYEFTQASGDPEEKINITTDFQSGNLDTGVKYSVNVTNSTLTVNATRSIRVTS